MAPEWATRTHLTPFQKRWLKRLFWILLCSFVFAGTPILLVSSECYLMGRWGILSKIGRRLYALKNVRIKYRRKIERPNSQ